MKLELTLPSSTLLLNRGHVAIALSSLLVAGTAFAQSAPDLPQPSPKARVEQRVGVTDFSVQYSSPAVKGRKVWGALVPFGELWRAGANAATRFEASRDFTFGGKKVPAGKYALYVTPTAKTWTIHLNSNWDTGGTGGYDKKNDVATVALTPAAVPHRERLTFIFSDTTDDGARLDLEWEKLRVSIPLKVDTKAHVLAGIESSLKDAWRPHFASARWHLEQGGDLQKALGYADTSIGISATWWNHWVKAQILAKLGRNPEAISIGEKADALGKGDGVYERFFKTTVTDAVKGWKSGKKS